ncbi:MAG: hypothetical protein HOM26_05720 [Polaribacter sp.]|nr:hypothetical protein [Polaribacter sp.]
MNEEEFIKKYCTVNHVFFGQFLDIEMTPYFLEINHPGINLENKEKIALIFKAINSSPESQKVTFRTSDFPNGIQ